MSSIHCAPQDSVRIFKDIMAKRAVGMHWGCVVDFLQPISVIRSPFCRAWVLTAEDVLEPPKKLAEECNKAGIEEGAFGVCEIGETLFI